jgi:hypothetical protein
MLHSVSVCVWGGRRGWVVFGVQVNERPIMGSNQRGRPMVLLPHAKVGTTKKWSIATTQIMMSTVVNGACVEGICGQ